MLPSSSCIRRTRERTPLSQASTRFSTTGRSRCFTLDGRTSASSISAPPWSSTTGASPPPNAKKRVASLSGERERGDFQISLCFVTEEGVSFHFFSSFALTGPLDPTTSGPNPRRERRSVSGSLSTAFRCSPTGRTMLPRLTPRPSTTSLLRSAKREVPPFGLNAPTEAFRRTAQPARLYNPTYLSDSDSDSDSPSNAI
jgi:hypothetical protein